MTIWYYLLTRRGNISTISRVVRLRQLRETLSDWNGASVSNATSFSIGSLLNRFLKPRLDPLEFQWSGFAYRTSQTRLKVVYIRNTTYDFVLGDYYQGRLVAFWPLPLDTLSQPLLCTRVALPVWELPALVLILRSARRFVVVGRPRSITDFSVDTDKNDKWNVHR